FWVTDLAPNSGFTSGDTSAAATALGGTVSMNDNGTPNDPTDDYVDYSPPTGVSGVDTFWYQACDTIPSPNQGCETTFVLITIEPNTAPVCLDDIDMTPKDVPVDITVLANDYDLTGNFDPATVDTTAGGGPSNGTVTFNATTGVITYTPNSGYVGNDTFQYMVCDDIVSPNTQCDTAYVYVTVYDQYTIAIDDDNSTFEDIAVSGTVLTNDFDPENDTQTFGSFLNQTTGANITSGATLSGTDETGTPVGNAGTLTFAADGSYTFTPASGFTGKVEVKYFLCDNGLPIACDTATLSIAVKPMPDPSDVNDNSVFANNDDVISYGNAVSSNALSNDGDPDLDDIYVNGFEYDSNGDGSVDASGTLASSTTVGGVDVNGNMVSNAGSLVLNANGNYTFTPSTGFEGTVIAEYETCDTVSGANKACANAIINITVYEDNGVSNDPPFAGDDFVSTSVNVAVNGSWVGNDYDYNGDSISINGSTTYIDVSNLGSDNTTVLSSLTTDQGGTVNFHPNGNYTYIPPSDYFGPDQVSYAICDKSAATPQPLCDDATIYMSVNAKVSDYGDLDKATYGEASNIFVDKDDNGIPEGLLPIWLGATITNEDSTESNATATADADDGLIIPAILDSSAANTFKVIVNSTVSSTEVHFKLYIDWNQDGTWDLTKVGYGTTGSPDTVDVNVSLPSGEDGAFSARLRVAMDSNNIAPTGIMNNGETEDYLINLSPVPVELLYFEAVKKGNDAMLTWSTATEINNSHFDIQRTTPGQQWETIGRVKGAGNSVFINDYNFVDENPFKGVNYYRLKQVDFDGAYEYSNVELLKFDATESISVYPNPTRDVVNVSYGNYFDENVSIIIVDVLGKELVRRTLNEDDYQRTEVQINVSDFDAGYYFLTVHTDDEIKTVKLLVQ
ncbi:MAG: tandem-95 repeat protein, partial [Bacteroidia bacterium]|nr:tandem-95 repeat protein [Bacteroidia bacterium]